MPRQVLMVLFVLMSLAGSLLVAPRGHAQEASAPPTQATSPETQDAGSSAATPLVAVRGGTKGVSIDPQIHDLSPWRMFMGADIVVKGVMIGLAFASVVTWTVFLAKTIEIALSRARLSQALDEVEKVRSLSEARALPVVEKTVFADLLSAAEREFALSADAYVGEGVKERAASKLSEVVKAEAGGIRRGMGLLATIGSTAPFVGLFGTVWGIMNSFIGISKSQTTNLAVVAPGIAEALLATAIGLVAAIPAVIIYNHFSRGTRSYVELLGRASGATGRLLSRDIDRHVQHVPLTRARA